MIIVVMAAIMIMMVLILIVVMLVKIMMYCKNFHVNVQKNIKNDVEQNGIIFFKLNFMVYNLSNFLINNCIILVSKLT